MIDNKYRVLVVGPTGVGKSQLCNYVQRDFTNSINAVSDSFDSCTKDPRSNEFERIETKFDFIDTAGNSDSDDDDIENLKKLIDYLQELKKIHYIILVLKFGEKINKETREYLETLGKMFNEIEFFRHLCIVFTKFPNYPKEEDLKTKDKHTLEINKVLRKIFKLKDSEQLGNDIYFIDTRIDKEDEKVNQKNQKIIDIILKQILLNNISINPINTENLDITGKSAKLRKEKELEIYRKKLEEEIRKKEMAEKEAIEAKKREEEYKKEMEKKKKEMEKANETEKQKMEKEYKQLLRKREDDKKKYEAERKAREEENERIIKLKKDLDKKKKEIDEEKKQNQIICDKLETLAKQSEDGRFLSKIGAINILGSVGLGILGGLLTPFCPVAGPALIGVAIGSGVPGVVNTSVGIGKCIDAEIQKSNLKKDKNNE